MQMFPSKQWFQFMVQIAEKCQANGIKNIYEGLGQCKKNYDKLGTYE